MPAYQRVSTIVFSRLDMKSTLATAIAVVLHTISFALGCLIWLAVGYGIGLLLGTPISGALTGLVYQLGCYIWLHDHMWAQLEHSRNKFMMLLN